MKRSRKPIPRRSAKRPAWRASEQREVCMDRAQWRCEFEVAELVLFVGWRRCGAHANDVKLEAAHVYRKPRIGNREAIDDPDVVIAGCLPHHRAWDGYRRDGLRINPDHVARARAAINRYVLEANKIRPDEDP
jgi:hypothetical protein